MSIPTFSAVDTPKQIVDGTGTWLAERFEGFRWLRGRGCLERQRNTQTHRLILQPKRANRTGERTDVGPRVTIIDERLADWRRTHGARHAQLDPDGATPMVFNTLFVNVMRSLSTVRLFGPTPSTPTPSTPTPAESDVSGFVDYLDETVVPMLENAADPALFVSGLEPAWWKMIDASTVEWALAHDDRRSASALVKGALSIPLRGAQTNEQRIGQFVDGWDLAREGLPITMSTPSITQLGWVSSTHDLVAPDDLEVAISP